LKLCPVCHTEYPDTEQFCTSDGGRLVVAAASRSETPVKSSRTLVVHLKDNQRKAFPLGETAVTIGAAADNTILVTDSAASRHHAEIKWRDGHHFLIDHHSTNGVVLNDKRIGAGEHVLRAGDRIQIGRTTLTYEVLTPAKEPPRDPAVVDVSYRKPPASPPVDPPVKPTYAVKPTGELSIGAVGAQNLALDGKYQLEALLSHDSLGALYSAKRLALGDQVAVRILRPSLTTNKEALERFRRQALVAARVRHPNSVQVYDFVTSPGGAVYIVEELLKGPTLRELMRAERGLTVSRVVGIFNQICGAVHASHLNGIVLRDLTPDTIRIERTIDGQEMVKVSGTGLARIDSTTPGNVTMAGLATAQGPAHYMSPEQWLGKPLDSRSDVYSLGVILFEVLTGRVPFDAPTRPEIAQLHVSAVAPDVTESGRPDLDESVAAVVSRALSKTLNERQPTALHFAAELEAAAGVGGGVLGNVIQRATGLLSVRPVVVPAAPAPTALGEAYLPPVVASVEEKGRGSFSPVLMALMAEAFLSRVSGGLVKTAVPLFGLLVFGLKISSVMGLVLIQNVVPLLLRPLFGSLADKYGKKRVFVLSLVIRTLVSLLFAVADLRLLFIASAIRGIADSAKGPSASAMIADHTDEKNIAKAYSWYTTTKSTSGSIGETIAVWLLPFLLVVQLASETVGARVAIVEDLSRPSKQVERILGPIGETAAPAGVKIIRIEERQIKLSDVPLDDLPKLVDYTPLRRTLVLIFLLSTAFSAVSVVLVMVFIKEKEKKKKEDKPKNANEAVASPEAEGPKGPNIWAFALWGTVLTAPGYMVTGEFFIILAVKLAITAKVLWWIKLVAEMFIPLFFGPFFGWIADRVGAGKVIALRSVTSIVTSVLFWTTSLFTGSAFFGALLGLARGLDEVGKAAFKPTWGAVAAKLSSFDLARRGRTMGILELGVDSADLIFPQVAGLIFERFGLPVLMVIRGLMAVIAEVYTFIAMRRFRI
jgi:MFS family permease/pSer/pThr/pTyr-binding forkhead associated (FHA) protein